MTNIGAYSINGMAMTNSEQLLVFWKLNPEKSGNLKRLKSHLVNGCSPPCVVVVSVAWPPAPHTRQKVSKRSWSSPRLVWSILSKMTSAHISKPDFWTNWLEAREWKLEQPSTSAGFQYTLQYDYSQYNRTGRLQTSDYFLFCCFQQKLTAQYCLTCWLTPALGSNCKRTLLQPAESVGRQVGWRVGCSSELAQLRGFSQNNL